MKTLVMLLCAEVLSREQSDGPRSQPPVLTELMGVLPPSSTHRPTRSAVGGTASARLEATRLAESGGCVVGVLNCIEV